MVTLNKHQKNSNVQSIYPLSPMQQGMLFHTLYAPDSGVYCLQMLLTIDGQLDSPAFQRAWQKVMERHSVLRTLFVLEKKQQPLQVVRKQVDLPWSYHDWQHLSPTEQQQHLDLLVQDERQQGFQLNIAPLMRFNLVQLDQHSYKFLWSYHHILMDGWCLSILFQEFLSCYDANRQGHSWSRPTPRPYQDYIVWLQQQNLAEAEKFWRQTLSGFRMPTPLGVERSQSQGSGEHPTYQQQTLHLSVATTQGLQSLTRHHHLTLATVVQAAWALLLSRYSGESDVVFGVTVSGRPASLPGVESMVGLFINTLPLRLSVDREMELLSWLQQVQQAQVAMQEYFYSPLFEVQQLSEVPAEVPLFDSIVVFENYLVDEALGRSSSALNVTQVDVYEQSNYPLTLLAAPGEEMGFKISYDSGRFAPDTIDRMVGHLQVMLEAMVADPQQRVKHIPLLTEPERQQLLVEWNQTAADYPLNQCIHQLFEAQVERTPDAVAVVFEDRQLSYEALNARANQLAHHLQGLGVGPEVLVGICMERSLDMMVGLLGILKTGGAYVPLDPTYPLERIAYMLSDAAVPVLLTQQSLQSKLPDHSAQVLCLDADWEDIAQHSQNNCCSEVKPENLVYVIYTSGSTGKPKGTAIIHRGLVNYLSWCTNAYQVHECTDAPVHASIGFDATITGLFSPLLVGSKVVLLPEQEDVEALATVLRSSSNLSLVKLTPAHLQLLNTLFAPEDLFDQRQALIIGGETLPAKTVSYWLTHAPETRLINEYGPTETVVGCCVYEVTAKDAAAETIAIGRPIANTQIYILDRHLQPVPIGVPGELHIGGAGLARGYLNRPDLTAEKFIDNPFKNQKSKILNSDRLYKTGDLARYLPDGNIEYLGRIDHQVKVRGFRIELGEIEVVLSTHPQVQQAVVVVREDEPRDQQLVAYIVITAATSEATAGLDQQGVSLSELRRFLTEKLPSYMVPSTFMILAAIPLTPNGKVDRKALPSPERDRPRELPFIPPHNDLERQLANIWYRLLSQDWISVRDSFFDLGGHSLLAVQLINQIQSQFQMSLPLTVLFQNPTIEGLAQHLQQEIDVADWSSLVPIQTQGAKQPFFCLPGAGGNVLHLYELSRSLGTDQPLYGLQAQGLDGQSPPLTSIEEIASDYVELIRTVQPEGPYCLGGHSFGGRVAFEMARQLVAQGHPIRLLAILDTCAPLPNLEPVDLLSKTDADWNFRLIEAIEGIIGVGHLGITEETLQSLSPVQQRQMLHDRLLQTGVLSAYQSETYLQGLLQVFKANIFSFENYVLHQPVPVPITLFRTEQPEETTELLMLKDYGWNQISTLPVEIQMVPGSHLTMMAQPHVQVLAEKIAQKLT